MNRILQLLATVLLVTLLASTSVQIAEAGDLDEANKIISGKDRSSTSKTKNERSSATRVRPRDDHEPDDYDYDADDVDADDNGEAFAIAVMAVTFPWWGPYLILEGDEYPPAMGFHDYPYADGAFGSMVYERDLEHGHGASQAARIALGAGYMGSDGWRATARADWYHESRIKLDVGVIGFGEFDDGELDSATFFSTHVGFRFVQTEDLQMHTGIGAVAWQTQGLWAAGVDFYYGFDWFVAEPIVISMNAELGSLGKAFRFGFQGSFGVLIDRTEIYLGWEHFVLARETSIELGGPQLGVRLWI